MIGYVTLGTNDLARGAVFYDALAREMGVGRMMETERFIGWGAPGEGAGVGLTKPFDGERATVGNGVMVALEAKDRAQVDRLYAIEQRRYGLAARRNRSLSAAGDGGAHQHPAGDKGRHALGASYGAQFGR